MENSEKAKIIIEMIRRDVQSITNHYIDAKASLAKAELGNDLWEKEEDRMGSIGFRSSPYNVELARERVERRFREKEIGESVLAYAIDTFLSKI